MAKLPSLFVSHGGPNVVTDDTPARDFLRSLSTLVERPSAIVVMSAHFETDGVAVVADPQPGMIYDFGGFSPELYEMVYPAPGSTAVAEGVLDLLDAACLAPQRVEKRGYDHGTWTPLLLGFPDADVPVVQVSVDPSRNAAWHHSVGAALAPLREEGVLLIGSGHITHNLRALFPVMRHGRPSDPVLIRQVNDFVGWFADTLAAGDTDALLDWRRRAPHVAENHPTDEHLMPIFFAHGAAGEAPRAERVHASKQYGFFAWDSYLFH